MMTLYDDAVHDDAIYDDAVYDVRIQLSYSKFNLQI